MLDLPMLLPGPSENLVRLAREALNNTKFFGHTEAAEVLAGVCEKFGRSLLKRATQIRNDLPTIDEYFDEGSPECGSFLPNANPRPGSTELVEFPKVSCDQGGYEALPKPAMESRLLFFTEQGREGRVMEEYRRRVESHATRIAEIPF